MGVIFRLVFRFLVIVLVLAILGVLGIYYLASRSLPDYDKTIALVGPTAPIEIVRDTAGEFSYSFQALGVSELFPEPDFFRRQLTFFCDVAC